MTFTRQHLSALRNLPLLILLIGLSGCVKNRKKNAKKVNTKKSTLDTINIPTAHESVTVADDESIRNFFDQDIEEFVSLAKEEGKNSTSKNISSLSTNNENKTDINSSSPSSEYAWINSSSEKDQEFQTIYFDFDSHDINKDQETIAKNDVANAQIILTEARKNNTNPTIVIEGHACHSAGSSVYNLALSEKRAKAISDWFVSQNIPKENIKIVGRGFELPAMVDGKPVEGDKQQQWANRRVEIHVLYS